MRKIIIFIFIGLLITLFLSLVDCSGNTERLLDSNTKKIEVKQGDTLWEIASKVNDNTFNKHRLITVIKEINKLDTVIIRSGQVLEVPIIKTEKK